MCTRYAIINRVSELKVHIELTRFVQPEKIEIDANERAVNEKSQYCFFVCTTFDSFLNDLLQLSIACGTMMSDKFLYDYEGPKMLLARLFLDIIKPINGYRRVNEKTIDKYEKFKQSYKEPDKFMLPKEESEIYEMLDDYFQNTR